MSHAKSTRQWTYRKHADVVIGHTNDWAQLSLGACKARSGNVLLVELKDLCWLPSANGGLQARVGSARRFLMTNRRISTLDLAKITTEFILFGPFYDQHHANFGPLTELVGFHCARAPIFFFSNCIAPQDGTDGRTNPRSARVEQIGSLRQQENTV